MERSGIFTRPRRPVVGSLLSVALFTAIWSGCGRAPSESPERSIAQLQVIRGTVSVVKNGRESSIGSTAVHELAATDVIRTHAGSEAVVLLGGEAHVVGENSEYRIDAHSPRTNGAGGETRVSVIKGLTTFFLPISRKGHRFQAMADTVVAAAKGTIFSLEYRDGRARVTVLRGLVDLLLRTPDGTVSSSVARTLSPDRRAVVAESRIRDEPLDKDESSKLNADLLRIRGWLRLDVSQF